MAGMPKTGKSTFLGALYHVLETGSAKWVELEVLPSARQHLEGLRGRWLRVEPEGRTPPVSPALNELRLRAEDGGRLLLRWPDLSGEYFDDMVRMRTLNVEVAEILQDATALVIFVHPDTVTQQPRIHEVNRIAVAADSGVSVRTETQAQDEGVDAQEPEWGPMMVRGQVLVVELIQLLLDNDFAHSTCAMSIVLSAWDVVPSNTQSPKEYVTQQLPLLNQFLEANSDRCNFKVFGVSALDGDPEDDKNKLQVEIDPVNRIRVVHGDGSEAEDNILAPIRWLLE